MLKPLFPVVAAAARFVFPRHQAWVVRPQPAPG
jgi:hypothetical protein